MSRQVTKRRTIAEQLRDLINDRGLSGYALARSAGVNRSVVNRFLAGGGLTVDVLDAIAAALGLRLVETGRRGVPRRGSARPAAGDAP
jgi:transcriptional regulator with XRE-family HTH domain